MTPEEIEALNVERAKRSKVREILHQAFHAVTEGQRCFAGPENHWSDEDWKACQEQIDKAAGLLNEAKKCCK